MQHAVQFFDLPETLGSAISHFVEDRIASGCTVLLVARPTTVTAVTQTLSERGVSLDDLARSGRVIIRDASGLMREFMGPHNPTADRFEATVGALVRELAAGPGGLAIYGEMVDLLAAEGNFEAAEALEHLWNELGQRVPFSLLCGYAAAHFAANATATDRLPRVCDLHSEVRRDHADLLANWLLSHARPAS